MSDYRKIARHYEACFERHGDTHLGVDWPGAAEAERRYEVMLEVIPQDEIRDGVRLLDVGCGAGHLLRSLQGRIDAGEVALAGIDYAGLDISESFIAHCRRTFPGVAFHAADLIESVPDLGLVDYAVLNGVFTERVSLSHSEMTAFFRRFLEVVHGIVRRGLAFNVMSSHVDWERDDLFHLPLDEMADFVIRRFGRHFVVRNDYGLYEYTVYLYKAPSQRRSMA